MTSGVVTGWQTFMILRGWLFMISVCSLLPDGLRIQADSSRRCRHLGPGPLIAIPLCIWRCSARRGIMAKRKQAYDETAGAQGRKWAALSMALGRENSGGEKAAAATGAIWIEGDVTANSCY